MNSCDILKKINKYHETEPPAFGLPEDLEPEEYLEIYFLLSQRYPNYAEMYRRKMNAARADIDRRKRSSGMLISTTNDKHKSALGK